VNDESACSIYLLRITAAPSKEMAETAAAPAFGSWATDTVKSASESLQSPVVKYAIYTLVLAIVIASALMIADSIWPFLPFNPVTGPSAAARAGKTFWRLTAADSAPENLIVPEADSPIKAADNYTMSVQLVIGDSRTPSAGKFRHIAHRGSNPCGLAAPPTPGPNGQAGIQPGDLPPNVEATYSSLGLPQIMNPGIFLDKYKNDIHIFVHTTGVESGMPVLWLETTTLEDLPLQKPLTLGVICNGKTVEIYINCKLYSTLVLRGKPYLPKSENVWYGRYCAYPMSGIIKNLQLWGDALNSGDYQKMCGGAASFDMGALPQTCASAPR
jgi:hypothetical protein